MSGLRTTGGPGTSFALWTNDDRAQPQWYSLLDWKDPVDELWPRARLYGSEGRTSTSPMRAAPQIWDWSFWTWTGAAEGQKRHSISGTVRDSGGAVVASAQVHLYRTSTDEEVDQVTSATDGTYVATSPYDADPVYAVGYKTGSPDTAGTTVNTLVPTA